VPSRSDSYGSSRSSTGLVERYDRFFEMDADLSHDVKYLPAFVKALTPTSSSARATFRVAAWRAGVSVAT